MSENSSIEWTHHTFNHVRGCTKVSPGCAHCYAARDAIRFPNIRGVWGDKGTRILAVPSAWKQPLAWNRKAEKAGVRARVFCASLADVFEDWRGDLRFPADIAPEGWVPAWWDGKHLVREFEESAVRSGWRKATMDDARHELFGLIEMTPWLDWQLVTKRPENVMAMVPESWREGFPDNVWIGTTVEDQARANERIPILLQIPAKIRFLSCEPLLEPVDLGLQNQQSSIVNHQSSIHWVITGGESGNQCRHFSADWARDLRDQCKDAGVPFFMKQMGGTRKPFPEIPDDLMIREFPVGKEGA